MKTKFTTKASRSRNLALLGVTFALAACGGNGEDGGRNGATLSPNSDGLPVRLLATSATAEVTFNVSSSEARRAISARIYGVNLSDFSNSRLSRLAFNRAGGNRLTAYNWETNASNAGGDYLNQNDGYLSSSNTPGAAFTQQIRSTLSAGRNYVMTIPMIGYVAADKNGGGDVNQTPGFLNTRFVKSVARKGSAFSLTPNTGDNIVYQDEFVNFLKQTFPSGFSGSQARISFMLDNEPDLWFATHRRLRGSSDASDGTKASYAELFSLTKQYATAIKDVVPNALVYGPANYGWDGYSSLSSAPDANGRPFIETYLDEMKTYEQANGRRIVDVLDLHYYPEARSTTNVRVTDNDNSAPVAQARMQSVRSLYDPTYTETSWITQWSTNGPINLLPRMQSKIDGHYPGTKLSFGEYDFGGAAHISGGVAEADVLGAFGRAGVFSANYWGQVTGYILAGLEMYRNFDGAGGRFGDTSIKAATSNIADTAVYASVDSSNNNRMVVVMINRSDRAITTSTQISHPVALTHGHLYRLTSTASAPTDAGTVAVSGQQLTLTLPAFSVSLVELTP
jgi:hypothetical protein